MKQDSIQGIPSYDSKHSRRQYKVKSSWKISCVSEEFMSDVSETVSDSVIRVDVIRVDDVELVLVIMKLRILNNLKDSIWKGQRQAT
jgi:hypothetical protein